MKTARGLDDLDGLKELWKTAFGDEYEFTDILVKNGFLMPEGVFSIKDEDKTVSALNAVNYPFGFFGKTELTYICSAATLPEYRGKGLMSDLIRDTLKKLSCQGKIFAALIPMRKSLFDYYAKFGFSPVFGISKDSPSAFDTTGNDSAFEAYTAKYAARNLCCFKDKKRFFGAADEYGYEDGLLLTGKSVAFSAWDNDAVVVREYAGMTFGELINGIKNRFPGRNITVENPPEAGKSFIPNGMCRLLDVNAAVKRISADKEADFDFTVRDELIVKNRISVSLHEGKMTEAGYGEKISVAEFTNFIFEKYGHGYINAILN